MFALIDDTTGAVIADRLSVADNPWTRFRGLMLRRALVGGEGLLISPCGSIHMMFMRFRIDAVFIDRENVVTKVAANVPRWWGIAFGGRGARSVIELPAGCAQAVSCGDRLRIASVEA